MTVYATDTIVVRVGEATKTQLAERAAANDRSLSAETRRALRAWLDERTENEEEARTHE